MTGEITERYEQFARLVGVPRESDWLYPPVTNAEAAFTEEALGIELPADLRVKIDKLGPWIDGPQDEVYDIYVQHRVSHAPFSGMIGWMSWPGSAEFSVD